MPTTALAHVGMTWLQSLPGAGTPTLNRIGRAGHGRHGGEASAMWGGPMMSALNFRFLFFKKSKIRRSQKGRKILAGSRKSCNFAARKPIVCVPFR